MYKINEFESNQQIVNGIIFVSGLSIAIVLASALVMGIVVLLIGMCCFVW